MAVTFSSLTSGEDGNGGASSETASIAPAADAVVLVAVSTGLVGAATNPTSLSGLGLSWFFLGGASTTNVNLNVCLFYATTGGSPPTPGAVTINYAGTPPTNCIWEIVEATGVADFMGDFIPQFKSRGGAGFSFSNPSVTLAEAPAAANGLFGAFTKNDTGAVGTAGGGYLQIGTGNNDGSPSNQIFAQRLSPIGAGHDGVFDMSWDGSSQCAMLVVELAAAEIIDPPGEVTAAAQLLGAGTAVADSDYTHIGVVLDIAGTGSLQANAIGTSIGVTLTNRILDLTGAPVAGVPVTAVLKPPGATLPGQSVIATASDVSDANGDWSLFLTDVSLISPEGAYYVITEGENSFAVVPLLETAAAGVLRLDVAVDFPNDGRTPALLLFSADARYQVDETPEQEFPNAGVIMTGLGSLTAAARPDVVAVTVMGGDGQLSAEAVVTPAPPEAQAGIMTGWHEYPSSLQGIARFRQIETALGKNFAIARMYESSNRGQPNEAALSIATDHSGTRTLMWSVKSDDWKGIYGGSYDSWINTMGSTLNGLACFQVIFIFYHEPHDNFSGTGGLREPADYSRAVEYIRNKWRDAGYLFKHTPETGQILMGYCGIKSKIVDAVDPIWYGSSGATARMDDCIDVLCHDSYNQIVDCPGKANRLFGLETGSQESWRQLLELADVQQKPIVIGEWGSMSVDPVPCNGCGFHDDLKANLAKTNPPLPGGPYTPDRNGWFRQAAYFMENNALAKKWLKGFCYFHATRWAFVLPNGTAHESGCIDDHTGDGVEGIDGFKTGFIQNDYFKGAAFDPLTGAGATPPPTDPPPGETFPCTSRSWSVGPALANGMPSALGQISGIAASPNLPGFWAVRDDTATAVFYCTETELGSGAFNAVTVTLSGSQVGNGDFEDIAVDDSSGTTYIYVHRNGGNENLTPKRLYRIEEPAAPTTATINAGGFVRYWQFPSNLSGNTCPSNSQVPGVPDKGYFNCEAIEVYNGRLYAARKRSGGSAEVFDFGPVENLSANSAAPSSGTQIGTISHGCPSVLALSTSGRSLMTVSHGTAKIWRALAGGSGMLACLDGNNELVEQISLPALDGDSVNTESGDWWPYNTCDIIIASESRNTYQFTGD